MRRTSIIFSIKCCTGGLMNLLKAIWSNRIEKITKNDLVMLYRKITILGIKLNFKLYEYPNIETFYSFIDKYIYYSWITQNNKNDFYRNIELFTIINLGQPYSKLSTLIIISSLIENDSLVQAEYMLRAYINKYNDDLIHEFLLVSKFALDRNLLKNDYILNAAKLYEILHNNETKNILSNILKDKTVAIVGNGASALGKGNGEEIDKNNIVIRFNNFSKDEKFIRDYGHKTDIWMVVNNFDFSDVTQRDLKDIRALWIACEINHQTYSKEYTKKLLNLYKKFNLAIVPMNNNSLLPVINQSGLTFPSSGYYTLAYLKSLVQIKKLNVYGFGFQDPKTFEENISNRYYEQRPQSFMGHNFYKEAILLKEMFNHN